jgi:hypothetical protein
MGEPAETTRGRSVIRMHRQDGYYRDRLSNYRVRIDGSPVGRIAQGETKDFFVPPGKHRVRLTIDWLWSSREVTFQVGEGDVAEFSCSPYPLLLLDMFIQLLVPRRYIRLHSCGHESNVTTA